jgi:hypothetical protein
VFGVQVPRDDDFLDDLLEVIKNVHQVLVEFLLRNVWINTDAVYRQLFRLHPHETAAAPKRIYVASLARVDYTGVQIFIGVCALATSCPVLIWLADENEIGSILRRSSMCQVVGSATSVHIYLDHCEFWTAVLRARLSPRALLKVAQSLVPASCIPFLSHRGQ